jgi:hypothetical protein
MSSSPLKHRFKGSKVTLSFLEDNGIFTCQDLYSRNLNELLGECYSNYLHRVITSMYNTAKVICLEENLITAYPASTGKDLLVAKFEEISITNAQRHDDEVLKILKSVLQSFKGPITALDNDVIDSMIKKFKGL